MAIWRKGSEALPPGLEDQLRRLRRRYAPVLRAAAEGDFSREEELHAISRRLGHLLAREARKTPEERGGLRMIDISLAVDGLFPELRAWNQQAAYRHRLRAAAGR